MGWGKEKGEIRMVEKWTLLALIAQPCRYVCMLCRAGSAKERWRNEESQPKQGSIGRQRGCEQTVIQLMRWGTLESLWLLAYLCAARGAVSVRRSGCEEERPISLPRDHGIAQDEWTIGGSTACGYCYTSMTAHTASPRPQRAAHCITTQAMAPQRRRISRSCVL